MTSRSIRRVAGVTFLGLVAALAVPRRASPAMHLRLTGSRPAKDSVLAAAPTQICLWFSQKPMLRLSAITLTGPGGAVKLSDLTMSERDSAPIIARIEGPVPAGSYVISWRTASSDGHPIRGSIPFRVR